MCILALIMVQNYNAGGNFVQIIKCWNKHESLDMVLKILLHKKLSVSHQQDEKYCNYSDVIVTIAYVTLISAETVDFICSVKFYL